MRNLEELTDWINNNSLRIINTIPQIGVNKYLFIQQEFVKGNIKNNQEFQRKFIDFYGLKAAHFTNQFYESYFPKFDELKGEAVSRESITFILED